MYLIPIAFIVLLISGTAFAYLMGAVSVLTFVALDKTPFLSILPQRIFSQLDVFAFMAMPLFILTAEIMSRAGVTRSLIDFAMSIVGRLRGGLGHVNILTSVFFAGISGSAVADSAALSRTFVPEMKARGYDPYYAGAITAASSMIGPIIPPSIIMIIYGGLTGASVAALFIAGVLPGLLLAASLMALNGVVAAIKGLPGGTANDVPRFLPSLLNAAPALCLPVVILGSLVFGLATPTEGSAIAVMVALAAGQFYKGLSLRMILEAVEATARMTGTIFIILAAISVLGYLAGQLGWSSALADWVESFGLTGTNYLLFLVFIFLIAGMFMDTPVALTLLIPLFAPQAMEQGISSIQLGIVLCFNLCVGLITPPLGKCLVVVSALTKLNYWRLAFAALPFIAVQVLVLLSLVFWPAITLTLPSLFGFSVN
ncbi:Sialic acid TRAP transporter permease protein SiaT [Pelagimonas phthalicica]|uniref:TRAP transporter large permease protein n=1 Tax=Pelagimonas phthalicica TaxID=1037362 RepID=A0A238JFL7_9RHOB|nr:TRAP transporter large permease [Pelagimonas phthalicica]TDS92149.1 tripartite ATP-independent transporter DctM subunit [Pelagimonas phthalicica]SMX29205.1 Sialic acid TRAP transporter permease protein SiaT [Pelagimonas phthalicica]